MTNILCIFFFCIIFSFLAFSFHMQKVFTSHNISWWKAFVPFYNVYTLGILVDERSTVKLYLISLFLCVAFCLYASFLYPHFQKVYELYVRNPANTEIVMQHDRSIYVFIKFVESAILAFMASQMFVSLVTYRYLKSEKISETLIFPMALFTGPAHILLCLKDGMRNKTDFSEGVIKNELQTS